VWLSATWNTSEGEYCLLASRLVVAWEYQILPGRDQLTAVHVAVGPTIMLRSGALFDFLDPWSSSFTIEDIAHGLSNICRYAGQCRKFYSVAEHSIYVSHVAQEFEYPALMHDAAEAFLGDITRPLKQLVPEFKRIEAEVERVIFSRFGIEWPVPPEVKSADLKVLAAEQAQIMPLGTDQWARTSNIIPADILVENWCPELAKRKFLERFESIKRLN
jgi:uncharacterized protein